MSERNIYIEDVRAVFDKLTVSNLNSEDLMILHIALGNFSNLEIKYILRF